EVQGRLVGGCVGLAYVNLGGRVVRGALCIKWILFRSGRGQLHVLAQFGCQSSVIPSNVAPCPSRLIGEEREGFAIDPFDLLKSSARTNPRGRTPTAFRSGR